MNKLELKRYRRRVTRFANRLADSIEARKEIRPATIEIAEHHIEEGKRLMRDCAVYLMEADERASWGRPQFNPDRDEHEDHYEIPDEEMSQAEAYKFLELTRDPYEAVSILDSILKNLEERLRYL